MSFQKRHGTLRCKLAIACAAPLALMLLVAATSPSALAQETITPCPLCQQAKSANVAGTTEGPHDSHTGPPAATTVNGEICTEPGCHALDPSVRISPDHVRELVDALRNTDPQLAGLVDASRGSELCCIQQILDSHVLMVVSINAESRVKVDVGPAAKTLGESQWQTYLVRIQNLAGATAPLSSHSEHFVDRRLPDHRNRWMQWEWVTSETLDRQLSGSMLEYRIVRLRTEATGKRTAVIAMDIGQGTADIGFRNDVMMTFDCRSDDTSSERKVALSPSQR